MKSAELKPFKVGYGDEMIAFYPEMQSDAFLEEIQERLSNVSDTDDLKHEKLYEIRLEAIAEFSAESPKKLIKVKGEIQYVALCEKSESDLDAMKRFFGTRNSANEKIVRIAYNAMINSMSPTIEYL